jgi:hypothetical protein
VAVSDGASSSVFAREWARLLVDEFAQTPFAPGEVWPRIAALGRRWRQQVSSPSLPWYAEEKLAHGSHASLLVVTWDLAGGVWCAHAVGDTCLFVVRKHRLHRAFPLTRSAAFDNRPSLLSTEAARLAGPSLPEWEKDTGDFTGGDRFLLMTDALAAWFLAEAEAGKQPWEELPPGETQWPCWLQARRTSGALRNDDVTLIEVRAKLRPAERPA